LTPLSITASLQYQITKLIVLLKKIKIMITANSNQIVKKAALIAQIQQQSHGRGFLSADLSLQRFPIEPFIVATDFHMSYPFFPPHPHAGVSVLTYIFEDSENAFVNRDSFGDRSRIEAGGLHLTQAGKGIQHEEIPEIDGKDAHGLQLWVNHAVADRLVAAKAFHADKADVPEFFPTDKQRVRILLGEQNGVKGAIQAVTPVTLLDVHAQAGERVALDVPEGFNAWIFVIHGNGQLSNGADLQQFSAAVFEPEGNQIVVEAGNQNIEFLVGMGKPLNEPNVFGGPFVMTTADQLLDTKRRFGKGEMGELAPSR
jgi:quercetin 2,3-dioxygenase